jgi:hypothetical protein
MNPWLETAGVVLVALLGIVLGRVFSGFRKPYWTLGYFFASVVIGMLIITRFANSLTFMAPLFWVTTSRAKFVFLSLAVTMGLTTPLSRLSSKRERFMVCALMTLVVAWFSVLPFLVPALIQGRLSNLETRVDTNGICYQTTAYTCGPAAAVTALRKLGFEADEGEIAVLSHTSPVAGTLPRCLYKALQNRYGTDGLRCRFRHFTSLGQLKGPAVTLAVLKDSFFSDHCVAVLKVLDRMVVIADPVLGRQLMSHEDFEKAWRFSGIVLERDRAQNI